MPSQFFSATRIHDGHHFLPAGSVLEAAADGTIIAVHEAPFAGEAAYFDGILCPGFINVHCHLELSHMRGIIPEGTGLIPFLQAVTRERAGFTDEQKKAARHQAYADLLRNGVVAIGDIANTTDTLDLRALGGLHVHTFVETIGFTESAAGARLAYAAEVKAAFDAQVSAAVQLRQSIVPHAPYSVSPALFRLIDAVSPDSLISIHNQEAGAEDEYYRNKTGAVRELLAGFGIDDAFFVPSGKSSLQTYLPFLGERHPLILVHNTQTGKADIEFAQSRARQPFWCLCPRANLYIGRRLPDLELITAATDKICIGTDSLSSNSLLSPFAELQILKEYFPVLEWETLLRWATGNSAAALQMDGIAGTFTTGLKPGIVHISSLDGAGVVRRII